MKTVVLFFEKGAPTRKVWYYKLDPGRNLGKTKPLNDDDLTEFVALQARFADREKSGLWMCEHRHDELRPFDQEPKQGGRGGAARSEGNHRRDESRLMPKAPKFLRAFVVYYEKEFVT